MFNKVAAIQGVYKHKKTLKLDHVEWSRELGWRKAAPLGMPKLAVDIKVLKDEQQLLYDRADMKEQLFLLILFQKKKMCMVFFVVV